MYQKKILFSSNTFPINCIPTGNPLVSKPQGILIAGSPAKLTGTVSKSDKYIESGSFTKSPFKKAVVGQVGVNKRSTVCDYKLIINTNLE